MIADPPVPIGQVYYNCPQNEPLGQEKNMRPNNGGVRAKKNIFDPPWTKNQIFTRKKIFKSGGKFSQTVIFSFEPPTQIFEPSFEICLVNIRLIPRTLLL